MSGVSRVRAAAGRTRAGAHDTPAHDTPAHDTAAYATPAHGTSAHDTAAYATPAHGTSAHDTAAYATPAYATPAAGRPTVRDDRPGTAPHPAPHPTTSATPSFGTGSLSRAAALIHTLLTVEALLLLAASPGLAGLLLLGPAPGNLPLAAVCLLPLGPATAAALYALHHRDRDLTDLHPARSYWRGWRLNAVLALKLWTPLLAWLTVIAFTLTHFTATGLPGWWAVLLASIGVGSLLWGAHALVLTALFAFRARDTARLACYFLFRHGRATLGAASLLVLSAAGTAVLTEALPALLAAPLLLSLLHSSRPVIAETQEDFTA